MKHEHNWRYDHTVYSADDEGGHSVHRFCKCGAHQVANVGRWHKPGPKMWDMKMLDEVAQVFWQEAR